MVLPADGKALTQVGLKAMRAGIPVINLDWIFNSPQAYRCWVGGDNYGMGLNAAHYIGEKLKDKPDARVIELAGIDNLELTQQRTQGFDDGLKNYPNIKKVARQAAEFTVESGQAKMAQLLQAQSNFDALWNHDDDQGRGRPARHRAGRTRRLPDGRRRGGALRLPGHQGGQRRTEGDRALPADHGRLRDRPGPRPRPGQGRQRPRRVRDPSTVTCYSAVVDKENVDQYMSTGFARAASPTAGLTSRPSGGARPHRAITTRRTSAWDSRSSPRGPGRRHQPPEPGPTAGPGPGATGASATGPALRVGMVGYAFMGAAHSQGWRTAGRVLDLPLDPVLAAICGRDADAVRTARLTGTAGRAPRRTGGPCWNGTTSTSWTSAPPATTTPRLRWPRSPPESTSCARSRWPTPSPRRRR